MKNYLDLKNATDYSKLKVAGEIIKNGGLVLFPTETVYGLGANGLDENAIKKIYKAKGRAQDNPLILHVSNFNMVSKIAKNISEIEYTLMKTFWPGPFTIILDRTAIVPDIVTAGLDTVGVRMPSGTIANKLISYAGVPIAVLPLPPGFAGPLLPAPLPPRRHELQRPGLLSLGRVLGHRHWGHGEEHCP